MNDLTHDLAISAGAVPLKNGPLKGTLVLAGADIAAFAAKVAGECATVAEEKEAYRDNPACVIAEAIRGKFPEPQPNARPVVAAVKQHYAAPTYDLRSFYQTNENRQPSTPPSAGTSKE